MNIREKDLPILLKAVENAKEQINHLAELIAELVIVDEGSLDAQANATTISDNNGGRIELEHESPNTKIIKKT